MVLFFPLTISLQCLHKWVNHWHTGRTNFHFIAVVVPRNLETAATLSKTKALFILFSLCPELESRERMKGGTGRECGPWGLARGACRDIVTVKKQIKQENRTQSKWWWWMRTLFRCWHGLKTRSSETQLSLKIQPRSLSTLGSFWRAAVHWPNVLSPF